MKESTGTRRAAAAAAVQRNPLITALAGVAVAVIGAGGLTTFAQQEHRTQVSKNTTELAERRSDVAKIDEMNDSMIRLDGRVENIEEDIDKIESDTKEILRMLRDR